MDAQAFWNVIGHYNEQTKIVQIVLLIFILAAIALSYIKKTGWLTKFALGIANLFIAIFFFAWYGTEPIQKFFALPLYLLCGILFLYESWHNKNDILQKPDKLQTILLLLYVFYPFVSILLGNAFPQMVTHIMPCPIVSLSIAVYAGYRRKNKLLLALLTLWGLTGIKSIIFSAYEDIILLICGLYGVSLLIREIKYSREVDYE
ncbi:MAG: DUF6064 family protein [Muribaculaceae bacterium]|nr:DUF6064 family protein [Roseburia sp.]MCM1493621.1 DUF6064 family protein [Muribaculaceae bacterium]